MDYKGKPRQRPLIVAHPPASPALAWLSLLLRLAVGGVLFYAGLMKALAPAAEFAAAIEAYKILPPELSTPLSVALPWIEMIVGTYLIAGYATRFFAGVATLLFGVFLGVLGSAIARGIDLATCGCFGADALSPHKTIGMDAAFFLMSICLFFITRRGRSAMAIDTWIETP